MLSFNKKHISNVCMHKFGVNSGDCFIDPLTCPLGRLLREESQRRCNPCPSHRCTQTGKTVTSEHRSARSAPVLCTHSSRQGGL